MTDLLDQAIKRVRTLPVDMQEELARMMLRFTGDDASIYELSAEEELDLAAADAEVSRGELADADDLKAVFSKYRR